MTEQIKTTKRKNHYKVNEQIIIKALKRKAIVRELDIPNRQVAVAYAENGEEIYQRYNLWEIGKVRSVSKQQQRRDPLEITVKYFDDELIKVEKIDKGDWIDLRAAQNVTLKAGEFALIPLGIAVQLPRGYEANVVPRSSTFKNFGIIQTNSYGVIDESYCGDNDQWFFPAYALRDTEIKKNDRICQFRINRKMSKVNIVEANELGNKDRGGHGSTGTK